ncbi:hypothetical protein ID850_18760 [Xenorhabdus sp. Flor]|uniref:hypothetical protein n=1 Tax=Xenorhabdus cabanillasii TaxID=351673 RepID=UPI0019CA79CF|nr:hypothetical protein [Xenorhabdus sp. Flor]MBD2816718.1 hypothetical protein [Xenorhabdus sp. Flor]
MKNNMYDVPPSVLNDISCEEERFLVEDAFFRNDIFIARTDYPLSTNNEIRGVVSIHGRLFNSSDYEGNYSCFYDVELSIFLGKKKNEEVYYEGKVENNRFDAARIASRYMFIFSNNISPALEAGKLNKNSDFESFISKAYSDRYQV